jgi:hypothetical protein
LSDVRRRDRHNRWLGAKVDYQAQDPEQSQNVLGSESRLQAVQTSERAGPRKRGTPNQPSSD